MCVNYYNNTQMLILLITSVLLENQIVTMQFGWSSLHFPCSLFI